MRRGMVTVVLVVVGLIGVQLPASASDTVGLVDPATGQWHLRNGNTTESFFYGNPGDVPFIGDWDCDGIATPGLFRRSDASAYLRNSNTQGIADIRFLFGNPSDIPIAGDFNGDGCDTLSIYRPSEQRFYIINKLGENEGGLGAAEFSFVFGNPGDKPFTGDFDGDGITEVGLHRESTGFVYYRNTLTAGIADNSFIFGNPGDRFVAGDWSEAVLSPAAAVSLAAVNPDTPAIFRPGDATFYFRNSNSQGNATAILPFGEASFLPVAGDTGSNPLQLHPPLPPATEAVKACLVTDLAGVGDRSFNASAWAGVQAAMDAGFATEDSFFLESSDASDWQPNIDQMVGQGCEHIVTVGFFLGGVTAINATAHPEITWTMIDNILTDENFAPLNLQNVRELVYQTDQAAFAAGYLAAGVSTTGTLCTYGGANIPTVAIFMDGFTRGAAHYNEIKGTDVVVLGWDVEAQDGVFTGSFTDMGLARSTAESQFQEGCDITIPVGGAINLPAGDAIIDLELDAALIGVDADAFFAAPEKYQSLWLTTVEKAIAPLVTLSIQQHSDGSWAPGAFVGNLSNNGVGLSEFHDWDSRVSDELEAEVLQLLQDIKDGVVKADFIPVP